MAVGGAGPPPLPNPTWSEDSKQGWVKAQTLHENCGKGSSQLYNMCDCPLIVLIEHTILCRYADIIYTVYSYFCHSEGRSSLSDESSVSNFGFFRDFMSFSVCSIDLKSLLFALGTMSTTTIGMVNLVKGTYQPGGNPIEPEPEI